MNTPRILSVGQCAFDHRSLTGHLKRGLSAEIAPAETCEEALEELQAQTYDLVLVNRVLDADGSPGLNLIQAMKAQATLADIPVMLVSDQTEAQADAIALGACPGFGKSQLTQAQTMNRIQAALARQG